MLSYLLVATLATTVAGCGALSGSDITGKTIHYRLEYSGAAQDGASNRALVIDYTTNDGRREEKNSALPWTQVVGVAQRGFTPSVRAQLDGFGSIVCRIVADGKVLAQQTSADGPYPAVECAA